MSKSRKSKSKKKSKPSALASVKKVILAKPGKHYSKKQISKKLLSKYSKESIHDAIYHLVKKGWLKKTEQNRFVLNEAKAIGKTSEIVGIVDLTSGGAAYVISSESKRDIYIPQKFTLNALNGDEVRVAVQKKRGRPEGKIVEIIKRKTSTFVGTIQMSKEFAFLKTDKRLISKDIFIPLDKTKSAKDGDKAIAKIKKWPTGDKSPIGEIIDVLGPSGTNDIEMTSILIENGFSPKFSKEHLTLAQEIPIEIPASEVKNRLDFREITTFTIDPEDAKDFDDALSLEAEEEVIRIGVHIADVSHYVQSGSSLDKEAYERATSVYLPDRVCPMFPEHISNVVCSLRPNEDKLCFAVVFEFDKNYDLQHVSFGKTIIHSDRRFTYREAQDRIDSGKGDLATEVQLLNSIGKKLRKERFENGSIDFDSEEVRFKLDKDGMPISVYTKERLEANMLIEEYMLLANKCVAQFFSKLRLKQPKNAFLYRVHDEPDMAKLEIFANYARKFGLQVKFQNPEQVAATLNDLMKKLKGRPEQAILERLGIRSMAKAAYTTQNIGHFGLAFEDYTHFTSPIRRYPDVIVHRLLYSLLQKTDQELAPTELEEVGRHCSLQERNALSAEREAIKFKQVQFLMDKIGKQFSGVVSGVVPRGIFVELDENKCEGMVGTEQLGTETFMYDEQNVMLIGMETNTSYKLGDKVNITVLQADLERRRVDFALTN